MHYINIIIETQNQILELQGYGGYSKKLICKSDNFSLQRGPPAN